MNATPGLRAAIYARYSTDKQKDTSVEDQIRLCRRLCEQKGWQVTGVFTDHALSGKNALRPGYQRLIQAAERGDIDVIAAESQNRLSRDMADSANLLKRMNFFGVRIHTASENELDDMKVGVGGLVTGFGPKFYKSGRSIRYRRRDLLAWGDERRRKSTSWEMRL